MRRFRFLPATRSVLSAFLLLAPVVAACSTAVDDPATGDDDTAAVAQAQCGSGPGGGPGLTAGCGSCGLDPSTPGGCSETCFYCDGTSHTEPCTLPNNECAIVRPPAGTINLATTTARTPQLTVPQGDVVQVYGANLSALDPLLYVGNENAQVYGDQITYTTGGLTFHVPFNATTGKVVLVSQGQQKQARYESNQVLTVDSFRNTDAYRFVNYNVSGTDDLSWDDFRGVFGDADTTFNPLDPCRPFGYVCIPNGIPRPEAYFFYEAAVAALKGEEHCAGMMITSARFLKGKDSLSSYTSVPGGTGVFGIAGSAPPSGFGSEYSPPPANLDHHIGSWHMGQFSTQYLNALRSSLQAEEGLGTTPKSAKTLIDGYLAKGDLPLVVLRKGGHGHVMMAYATEPGGTMQCWGDLGNPTSDPRNAAPAAYRIHLEDPKLPFSLGTLQSATEPLQAMEDGAGAEPDKFVGATHRANLTKSTLAVDANGNWCHQGMYGSGTWTGGTSDLMLVPASVMMGDHVTMPNSIEGLVEILSGSSSLSGVADPLGNTLSTGNGITITRKLTPATTPGPIPNSLVLPLGGDGDTGPSAQAAVLGGTGPYTHTVVGNAAGTYMATFLGDGMATQLTDVTSAPGATDTITIDHTGGRVAFRSGLPAASFSAQVAASAADQSDRVVTIHSASATNTGDEAVTFSADRSSFTYAHAGAAGTLAFDLDDMTPNLPATHYTTQVSVAPGDTLTVTPSDWTHLDTAPIAIATTHADGSVTGRIQIDAHALSLPGFLIYGVPTPFLDTKTVQSLDLPPGEYVLQWYSAVLAPFSFTVNPNGTISYDPSYGSFLGGNGTCMLTVSGFNVTIDATKTDNGGLLMLTFNDMGVLDMTKPETLTLPPSVAYGFLSGSADPVDFGFGVDLQGHIQLDPSYSGFASVTPDGATVTLTGYPVTVHMNQSGAQWTTLNFGLQSRLFPSNEDVGLHLLPSGYSFLLGSSEVTSAGFSVGTDGSIQTDPSRRYVNVSGSTITLNGYPVTVDATAGGSGIFQLFSLFGLPAYDVSAPQTVNLLPTGGYEFMGLGKTFGFVMNDDGSISSDPATAGVTVQGSTILVKP